MKQLDVIVSPPDCVWSPYLSDFKTLTLTTLTLTNITFNLVRWPCTDGLKKNELLFQLASYFTSRDCFTDRQTDGKWCIGAYHASCTGVLKMTWQMGLKSISTNYLVKKKMSKMSINKTTCTRMHTKTHNSIILKSPYLSEVERKWYADKKCVQ